MMLVRRSIVSVYIVSDTSSVGYGTVNRVKAGVKDIVISMCGVPLGQ
jgi:hypothetical protein